MHSPLRSRSRSHCRLGLFIALALTAAVACKKDKPESSASLSVTLNEPGAEPRQALRFTPPQGLREPMVMTVKMGMNISGMPETAVPVTVMRMHLAVTKVEPNGNVHATFELSEASIIDDPKVMPAVKEATRVSLKELIGLRGSQTIDSRGFTIDATMEIPPDVAPQTRQMMEGMKNSLDQLMAPLPAEPVGVGATWTTRMPLTLNGMTLLQKANYTVTAIEGTLVTTDVTIEQSAKAQTIQQPNMPPVKLLSLASTGSGRLTFDTSKIVPTSTMEMESKSKLKAGGQTLDMTMTVELSIQSL